MDVGAAILIPTLIELEAKLPAKSEPVTVIVFNGEDNGTTQDKLVPESVAGMLLQFAPATPESESEIVPVTFTYGVLTKAPFAGLEMLTAGGVVSRLSAALVVAELLAESVVVP